MLKFQKCTSIFTKLGGKIIGLLKRRHIYHVNYYSTKNNGPWNILFFGTDEFALKSLQALHTTYRQKGLLNRLEIVTAYKGKENAVIKYTTEHNILLHNWPPLIKDKEFDIGIVVSFGHLIPSKIIKLFPLGMINVHGSLLPKWRGAAPICHALMNGDKRTGISIMKIMPKRFDIGSVIAQAEIEIQPHETYIDLYDKLATLGANVLIETMTKLPDVLNTAKPQSEEKVTYAPKITKEMSFIKWHEMTAQDVYNLQRALTGIEPLRTHFNNQIIKLINVKPAPETILINCTQKKVPGLAIFDKRKKALYVSCQGQSWISVETVIIPGRKPQTATDFCAGFILNRKEKSCIFCYDDKLLK